MPDSSARNRQPGLTKRMGSESLRISSQHRQLDSFYSLVMDSLEEGDRKRAPAAFQRFFDALDSHITLEDSIYFPALHGLRPEFALELADLVREHADLRADLREIEKLIQDDDLRGSADRLDALGVALAAHEGREELLLARITGSR
jgi:hypothetical protein